MEFRTLNFYTLIILIVADTNIGIRCILSCEVPLVITTCEWANYKTLAQLVHSCPMNGVAEPALHRLGFEKATVLTEATWRPVHRRPSENG